MKKALKTKLICYSCDHSMAFKYINNNKKQKIIAVMGEILIRFKEMEDPWHWVYSVVYTFKSFEMKYNFLLFILNSK